MRRMVKRRWFWLTALFLVIVFLAGYYLIPVSTVRISQANCDKIQLGWTSEQVENLLGNTGDTTVSLGTMVMVWEDEDGNHIRVDFRVHLVDLGGQFGGGVTQKFYTPTDLSLLERLKRRIDRRSRLVWPY